MGGKLRGGFGDDVCSVVWEDYPYGFRADTKDGRPIGKIVCLTHEVLVAFGVAKGDGAEYPELCDNARGDSDEPQQADEGQRPP